MRTRVLHILTSLAPTWATTQLRLLARELPPQEFELHAIVIDEPRDKPEVSLTGVPIGRAGRSHTFDLAALKRLRRSVIELRPDLIHAWSGEAAHVAHAVSRAAAVPRFVVSYSHAEVEPLWTQQLLNRALARRVDRMLVNCLGVRDQLAGRGWPVDKLRVIASGVEPPTSSVSRDELLAELGLARPVFLMAAVGQLRLAARWKDVIWAADMLKFIRDDVHLLIFGEGPQRLRLERFRAQVRIEDKVHFIGARADLARWLPHCDAFWSCREDAGQPLAMMEAMAAGVPAIATGVPGTRELIQHGESGYLVPVGDRAGMARWTHKLLEDRPLAAQFGAAGKARMLADFSPRRMADEMAGLYRDVLGSAATPRY